MADCEYCEALKSVIYSDGTVSVFFEKNAAVPGHIVVAPARHFTIFEQVPDSIVRDLFRIANKVSTILFDALGVQGTNVIVENGNAAGQKVPHVSVNVIPRSEGDGLNLQWAPKKIPEQQMSLIEVQLREEASRTFPQEESQQPVQEEEKREEVEEVEDDYMQNQLDRVP